MTDDLKTVELKTLEKKDPLFLSYLFGTFSNELRAIPVSSLNVSTEMETVTFEMRPVSKIQSPPFFKMWLQVLKVQNLILVLFPIFLVLSKNLLDRNDVDYGLALQAGVGALLLLIAVSLRNDVRDHISGLDRIQPNSGSRGIQEGWLPAAQVQKLSYYFFGVSLFFGIPSMLIYPGLIFLVVGLAIFAIFVSTKYPTGLKYRSGTELSVFFLFGPLLTVGYETAMGGMVDIETLFFGVITGWFAVFILLLKNFDSILISNQAGFENSITKIGFEKAKKLLIRWWLGFIFLVNTYHLIYCLKYWALVFFIISVVLTWQIFKKMGNIKSPVSSGFSNSIRILRSLGFVLVGIWILENLFYLLSIEMRS